MHDCTLRIARALALSAALAAGCSGNVRPVLYPNDHYRTVGEAAARRDVNDCMRLARDFGAGKDVGTDVARDTATGALIGGAAAGAWGAVSGNAGERALAGAAAGGAGGLVRGALDSGKPSATYQGFVRRCLSDRGYDVIGWE